MTLRSLAQELTEPHLTMIGGRIGKVPALLTELREAVSGSTHEGGSSGSKLRILVNADALDLIKQLKDEAQSSYTDRFGQEAPSLEQCITSIGTTPHADEWERYFTNQLQSFKTRIEAILRPKKMRRLDGQTCPACGQTTYGEDRRTCLYVDCWGDDDETLRPHQEWTVHCKGCETQWTGVEELKWVLVALSASTC